MFEPMKLKSLLIDAEQQRFEVNGEPVSHLCAFELSGGINDDGTTSYGLTLHADQDFYCEFDEQGDLVSVERKE